MKKVFAPFIGIAVFVVFLYILSIVFPPLMEFLSVWFLTKEEINAPLTTEQVVLIDIITHLVTYASVGLLFEFLGRYDKDSMHVAYVIISEAVSLALAILLRFIIQCYWIIFILLGVLVIGGVVLYIINCKKNSKKKSGVKAE